MSKPSSELLSCCLYFTANSLARTVSRMAEEEFGKLGMTPSHAFLLMVAIDEPGISQKDLAERLHLAQSTVSRFVDALVLRGLVEKKSAGKIAHVYPTEKGAALLSEMKDAWKSLYERYSAILGEEEGQVLTRMVDEAHRKLESAD
ncbi:MAG: MarR family transcriptional regulator [Deltaproteobacteria bacterium]|nr:MAG: MarR family transcriptional regulator [Deltaproteobacteria bacterium]